MMGSVISDSISTKKSPQSVYRYYPLLQIDPLPQVICILHHYGLSWLWSYGSWIYNYLCKQCLSSLKLC